MRGFKKKLIGAAVAGVAFAGLVAAPAFADSTSCNGPCTTRPVWRNSTAFFITVYVENTGSSPICHWTVRDYDNNKVVGSGSVKQDYNTLKQISGLYNRYTLHIDADCYGQLSD